jgi:hypothetical protein
LSKRGFDLIWTKVREAVGTLRLAMLRKKVLFLQPLLQLVLLFKIGAHLVGLVEPGGSLFVKLHPVFYTIIDFFKFCNFLDEFILFRAFYPLTNAHLEDLFGHCDFALKIDFDICEIQTAIVT